MHANSAEMMVGATLSTMAQPGKYTTPVPKMSDERGRPLQPHGIPTPASTSADFGTGLIMQSPAVIPRGISTPVLGPSLSPTSSVGQFDHASSASSTFVYPISSQHSAHHPNPAPRGSLQRNHSHTRRPPSVHSSASYPLPTGPVTSTADQLERQPRDASGYEWNERRIAQANDGTASLSVEPDGEGYLGELPIDSHANVKALPRVQHCYVFCRSRQAASLSLICLQRTWSLPLQNSCILPTTNDARSSTLTFNTTIPNTRFCTSLHFALNWLRSSRSRQKHSGYRVWIHYNLVQHPVSC